jgi:hypothetical protein
MDTLERKRAIWMLDKDQHIDTLTTNAQKFHNELDKDSAVADSFLRHFAELFRILTTQQNAGVKGSLRYVTMSFLRSGVAAETYEIATACHSADLYLDETETETYWQMDFLKEMIKRDMSVIVPNLRKKIVRLRGYEIEEFRSQYAYLYTTLILMFFMRVLRLVFALPEFQTTKKDAHVDISFGGYMEEGIVLASYGQEAV